jgi:hypothetical protein
MIGSRLTGPFCIAGGAGSHLLRLSDPPGRYILFLFIAFRILFGNNYICNKV